MHCDCLALCLQAVGGSESKIRVVRNIVQYIDIDTEAQLRQNRAEGHYTGRPGAVGQIWRALSARVARGQTSPNMPALVKHWKRCKQ